MRWGKIEMESQSLRLHLILARWSPVLLRWSLTFLTFLTFPVAFCQSPADEPDYWEIFSPDYENAINTLEENAWWSDTLTKHGIDPDFALSIVFPELIRYSSISNYIEVKALEVLYVQYGYDYADFSIGLFQMKPTFAEQIEADMLNYQLEKKYPELSALKPSITDNPEMRRDRIIRLKDEYHQLLYLEAFIRVMAIRYPDLEKAALKDRLLFYSTAYNIGYRKGDKVIRCEGDKARFYCGMITTNADKYNYAEIALDYYLSRIKNE